MEEKRIKWVHGNTLPMAIPMEEDIISPDGRKTVPYRIGDGDTISVCLVGEFRTYSYTPTVEDNIAYFTDEGKLPVGIYAIEVLVNEKGGARRRSRWNNVLEITRDNTDVLEEWDEFVVGDPVVLGETSALMFFAKGESLYELMVKEGRFVGTLDEFLQQYEDTLAAADTATQNVNATNEAVQQAESLRVLAENLRVEREHARQENEHTRQENETERQQHENARGIAERERDAAELERGIRENARSVAEGERETAEQARADAEAARALAETQRATAETTRESNEQTRIGNETARQEAEAQRESDTAVAVEKGSHPDYIGEDCFVYRYDMTTHQYIKTDIYVKVDPVYDSENEKIIF